MNAKVKEGVILKHDYAKVVNGAAESLSIAVERSQRKFQYLFCGFVLVVSFFWGIRTGMSKGAEQALAAQFGGVIGAEVSRLYVPEGVKLVPVGRDIQVNGARGETASFVTRREVTAVLDEAAKAWKARGFDAFGVSSKGRGIAIAIDPKTKERYSAIAYSVPPRLRGRLSSGFPTQGILTYVSADDGERSEATARGEIDGVPLLEGGTSGGVFEARELGGLSATGFYTIPRAVGVTQQQYREILQSKGWSLQQSDGGAAEQGSLRFFRDDRELFLLFSQSGRAPVGVDEKALIGDGVPSTVVFVVSRQRTAAAPE